MLCFKHEKEPFKLGKYFVFMKKCNNIPLKISRVRRYRHFYFSFLNPSLLIVPYYIFYLLSYRMFYLN